MCRFKMEKGSFILQTWQEQMHFKKCSKKAKIREEIVEYEDLMRGARTYNIFSSFKTHFYNVKFYVSNCEKYFLKTGTSMISLKIP